MQECYFSYFKFELHLRSPKRDGRNDLCVCKSRQNEVFKEVELG